MLQLQHQTLVRSTTVSPNQQSVCVQQLFYAVCGVCLCAGCVLCGVYGCRHRSLVCVISSALCCCLCVSPCRQAGDSGHAHPTRQVCRPFPFVSCCASRGNKPCFCFYPMYTRLQDSQYTLCDVACPCCCSVAALLLGHHIRLTCQHMCQPALLHVHVVSHVGVACA